jgi:microsomal epoxide hydrolase
VLNDLARRLRRTRWPDEVPDVGWSQGADIDYMKSLAKYWLDGYDWRKREANLNSLPWFQAEIGGKPLRYIHSRGRGPNPIPIVLLHGWPDSVYRYFKLIPMLTDPVRHGGDAEDSFDVIVPSLVGFSAGAGPSPHFMKDISEVVFRLMTEVLGYERFASAGGDGGSAISQLLAVNHPESLIGLHLTDYGYHATMGEHKDLSETERNYLRDFQAWGYGEGAYIMVQGTKPMTLAYGLSDSPVGFAAWIVEKMRTWSDCGGDVESLFSKDEILDNVMQYWLTAPTVHTVNYHDEFVSKSLRFDQSVEVPVGLALPPKDIGPVPPREFVQRNLKDIRRWTVLERGGHFAAMEFPALLAPEIRAFFHGLERRTR